MTQLRDSAARPPAGGPAPRGVKRKDDEASVHGGGGGPRLLTTHLGGKLATRVCAIEVHNVGRRSLRTWPPLLLPLLHLHRMRLRPPLLPLWVWVWGSPLLLWAWVWVWEC